MNLLKILRKVLHAGAWAFAARQGYPPIRQKTRHIGRERTEKTQGFSGQRMNKRHFGAVQGVAGQKGPSVPYMVSPTSGWPIWAICTRI